jgi:Bacterial protein of unknown function (DUF899)
MFGYGFRLTDERRGCTGCSLIADHFDGVIPHLNGRDITLVCESIAPLQDLQDYKQQMGWRFPWVSSLGGPTVSSTSPRGAGTRTGSRRGGAATTSTTSAEPGDIISTFGEQHSVIAAAGNVGSLAGFSPV